MLKCILKAEDMFGCIFLQTRHQVSVFDKALKARQMKWAFNIENSNYYDYLRKEATERLTDRLDDITRKFPVSHIPRICLIILEN